MTSYRQILRDGLWWNNPGLAQLLGLCPLLAVSRTLVAGLGLGIATLLVLCGTNLLVSLTRHFVDPRLRLPACVLVIAAFVTAVDLLFKAWWYALYLDVGLFIPLIVTNCVILGRAEAFAARQPPLAALTDGLAHGAGFALVLMTLGALREVVGYHTLFAGADMLFGPAAAAWQLSFTPGNTGLLIATLPPGAFFALALLVAGRNAWLVRRPREAAQLGRAAPETR